MACGQRVGLMTRAAVNQIDTGAVHRPPPFPTVLALDSEFPLKSLFGIEFGRWNSTVPKCDLIVLFADQSCAAPCGLTSRISYAI
jgi:hypothetical protein